MNNDELKKKIAYIIYHTGCTGACCECDYSKHSDADTYCKAMLKADALIEAGIGNVKEAETENAALRERLEKYKISFKKVYMDFFSKLNRDKDFRKRFDNVTLGCQLTMFEDALDKAEARLAELKGEEE